MLKKSSCCEFAIRLSFFPNVNTRGLAYVGITLVVVAQFVRTSAMITCGESFNHLIQKSKKDNHVLITTGIYKYLRHPSYAGFFYWSVGTQFLLSNYLHIVLFSAASWWFFHIRIPYEEETLLDFFGHEYVSYGSKTWIGIPFVRSPVLEYALDQKEWVAKKNKATKAE
uniref:Protein-S-isoprenylcysteine O-methyltransferase n=1 Tax=Grammatophora oceanica TaxID=210454 RepID=A0A7S1VFV4_9STRA|mmetsp:Transcript_455/g.608  ORF Transcript_455/g.608 Transcript_455/m.608 type:complete len:169 (+) Transcript_455:61-567(+)